MIKVSEIAEKYADYEIDEKELEKLLVKPIKSVWDLKKGDKYFILWSEGEVEYCKWNGDKIDVNRRACGNIFLTKEKAEFEVERKKCEAIMLKYGTRDMMSLGNSNTDKYYIRYDHTYDFMITGNNMSTNNQGCIYFASPEVAKQCVNEIGVDRLKKYIFNVKE